MTKTNNSGASASPSAKSSSERDSAIALLPEIFTQALAEIVADYDKKIERDRELLRAEEKAMRAELRGDLLEHKDKLLALTRDALTECKQLIAALTPLQGERGEKGDRGEKGEQGEKGDKGEQGSEGPQGERGAQGEAGPPGNDGEQGAQGERGAQGESGADGKDGARGEKGETGSEGPRGETGAQGARGEAGRPGISFEDIKAEYDGERRLTLKLGRDDVVKTMTFVMPIPIDRGVFIATEPYAKGDLVTYGGSLWIAQKDAPGGRPEESNSGWRLCVKRGRDGKDGREIVKDK